MTSRQHQDWLTRGRPDSGLARPLAQLRDRVRSMGYTVYDQPNDAHLDAEPPEDHTYYSETGWPNASPKWWRHAIDVMPSKGGADLYALGQRIVRDRNAGQAGWIKYINVPTSSSLTAAVQHRWEPGHSSGPSGDTGHIHISSVTGCENLDAPYSPFDTVAPEGTFMTLSPQQETDLMDLVYGLMDEVPNPVTRSRFNWRAPALAKMHDKVDAMATDVAALKAAQSAPAPVAMTREDRDAIVAALQSALPAVVLQVLQSPDGQTALVASANYAEDH